MFMLPNLFPSLFDHTPHWQSFPNVSIPHPGNNTIRFPSQDDFPRLQCQVDGYQSTITLVWVLSTPDIF